MLALYDRAFTYKVGAGPFFSEKTYIEGKAHK